MATAPQPQVPERTIRPVLGRALVVGGDDALRQGLERAPELSDVELDFCDGNAAAVASLRRRACDVVLTDPTCSVEEAFAFVQEVQRCRPGVRAILLALKQSPEDVLEALRRHIFATFTAPFEASEIATMVRRAIDEVDWHDAIQVVSGMPSWVTLRVSCRLVSAERLTRFMTEHRTDLGPDERDLLMVAFREILINAMEHGAGFDPEKVVQVTAVRTERAIIFHFRDPGPGFDREALAHAAAPGEDTMSHLDVRADGGMRPGGFGILLANEIVDEVIYNEQGNEVMLIKHLDEPPRPVG